MQKEVDFSFLQEKKDKQHESELPKTPKSQLNRIAEKSCAVSCRGDGHIVTSNVIEILTFADVTDISSYERAVHAGLPQSLSGIDCHLVHLLLRVSAC